MQDRLQELLKAAILVDSMEVDCLPGDHMGAQHLEAHMDHRHPVEDPMDTLPLALRVECMGVAPFQEGHMDSLLIPMVLPNLGPMGQVVMEVSGRTFVSIQLSGCHGSYALLNQDILIYLELLVCPSFFPPYIHSILFFFVAKRTFQIKSVIRFPI